MADTLRELSIKYATKQPKQVEYLLEGAPVLERMIWVQSTHGLSHVMERIAAIDAATFVQRDQPLPEADVTSELGHMDLGIMGFKIKAGVDKVIQLNGKDNFAAYVARRSPKIFSKTGMNTDELIVKLAKSYAIKNGNVIDCGGKGEVSSIVAIRLVEDETCGVYDPNGYTHGALFDAMPLSGGKPYEDKDGKDVYGMSFKSSMGFMFENPKTCAAIINIDKDHKPTAEQIDEMLLMMRAGSVGESMIVVNPAVATKYIDTIKVFNPVQGTNINTKVETWNGIDIIRDFNVKETEDGSVKNMEPYPVGEYGKEFFRNQGIASATAEESKAQNFGKGGQNSGVAIKAFATTALATAGGNMEILHSDKEKGTYETLYKAEIPATAEENELLFEYVLPSTFKGWAKVKLTGKEGATGTVTVQPLYIPR